jgi:hypothetical protein
MTRRTAAAVLLLVFVPVAGVVACAPGSGSGDRATAARQYRDLVVANRDQTLGAEGRINEAYARQDLNAAKAALQVYRDADSRFRDGVRKIDFPPDLQALAAKVASTADELVKAEDQELKATTFQQFQQLDQQTAKASDASSRADADLRSKLGLPPPGTPLSHFAANGLPVLVQDDLGHDARNFYVGREGDSGAAGYATGGYQLSFGAVRGNTIGEAIDKDLKVGETTVEADVLVTAPGSGRGAEPETFGGVLCRADGKANSFGSYYSLGVSSNGNYFIFKSVKNQLTLIAHDSRATQGRPVVGERQRVRGDCAGKYLTLYLNGAPVLQAADSDFAAGNAGVFAGSSQSNVSVTFTNFSARGRP